MSVTIFLGRIATWLSCKALTYLDLHLFISLCSWPLLAAWGLPFSPAGILGNILFTPFLSLFLIASSFLFLANLLHIPDQPFVLLLEGITSVWYILLSQSSRSWLFYGAHPPFIITLFMPAIACVTMLNHSYSQRKRILIWSAVYLICGFLIPRCLSYREYTCTVPFCKGSLTLIQSHGSTMLIDSGALGYSINAPQATKFSLVPFLYTHGIRRLDLVVVQKPSYMVFKSISILLEHIPIKTIYLPAWQGSWHNAGWASWEHLLRAAQDYSTQIIFLNTSQIVSCGTVSFIAQLSERPVKKNKLLYQELILEPHLKDLVD